MKSRFSIANPLRRKGNVLQFLDFFDSSSIFFVIRHDYDANSMETREKPLSFHLNLPRCVHMIDNEVSSTLSRDFCQFLQTNVHSQHRTVISISDLRQFSINLQQKTLKKLKNSLFFNQPSFDSTRIRRWSTENHVLDSLEYIYSPRWSSRSKSNPKQTQLDSRIFQQSAQSNEFALLTEHFEQKHNQTWSLTKNFPTKTNSNPIKSFSWLTNCPKLHSNLTFFTKICG